MKDGGGESKKKSQTGKVEVAVETTRYSAYCNSG